LELKVDCLLAEITVKDTREMLVLGNVLCLEVLFIVGGLSWTRLVLDMACPGRWLSGLRGRVYKGVALNLSCFNGHKSRQSPSLSVRKSRHRDRFDWSKSTTKFFDVEEA
jgi:hypothetical protein